MSLRIGPSLAILSSLLLLALLGYGAYFEHAYTQLASALQRDLAAAKAYRWERPVLRGAMGDGNAADEIYAALVGFQPLTAAEREALGLKVYFGQPLEAEQQAQLTARGTALRALRAAVQQRWSRTTLVPELGETMAVPEYARLIDAALSLLAEAQTRTPELCLQEAADVIRIGQDVVPAAPLEAASVSARLNALSARVITRCALHAELPVLRKITHELRVLATHPAPVGSCLELEELALNFDLAQRAALADKPPRDVALTLLTRPELLANWRLVGSPSRFRQIAPEHYPDALEDWRREQDFRSRELPSSLLLADATLPRLHDDMRGQALVRMLSIAVATLAERAYRGNLPERPSSLRDSSLSDPFRGQPFRYRIAPNGAEFTLWSVGADYRDDEGSDDTTDTGPRDVTLHVALR